MSDLLNTLPPARPASYHDFGGLAGLKGEASQERPGAVREAAKQFEAYFIQQMLKTMREAVERSDLVDNQHSDTFQEMFDKEVSVKMAERDIGHIGGKNIGRRRVFAAGVEGEVVSIGHEETGTRVRARLADASVGRLREYVCDGAE